MNKDQQKILNHELAMVAEQLEFRLKTLGFDDVSFNTTRAHMFPRGLNIVNFTLVFMDGNYGQ